MVVFDLISSFMLVFSFVSVLNRFLVSFGHDFELNFLYFVCMMLYEHIFVLLNLSKCVDKCILPILMHIRSTLLVWDA